MLKLQNQDSSVSGKISIMKSKKIKYVAKLTDKGFPTHSKAYPSAHKKANAAEKKANAKMYKAENKAEHKLKKGELMAKNTKSGKIEIEKKFKRFTPTLKIHESVEHKNILRSRKKR